MRGEWQITLLSKRNQPSKNRVKSTTCVVCLARLFFPFCWLFGASLMLGWMLTKLVKGLVMLRRMYNN